MPRDNPALPFSRSSLLRDLREAQRELAAAPAEKRTAFLTGLRRRLVEREEALLEANARDLEAALRHHLADPLRRRLALSAGKLAGLRDLLARLASDPDPLMLPLSRTELGDGLVATRVQAPVGLVLACFESRPELTIELAATALRAGNGILLAGGAEAQASNEAFAACLADALEDAGLPAGALVPALSRAEADSLLDRDGEIDLAIARGSRELVRGIQQATRIPVLGHTEGICHLYLDAAADPAMATHLAVDAKCDSPESSNAIDTLLVHVAFLPKLVPVAAALKKRGVRLLADDRARRFWPAAAPAGEADFGREWNEPTLSVAVVDDLDAAIGHIGRHGSGLAEAICTADEERAREFLRRVDAASVLWNASTRFADGYCYGLGAGIASSTGRGPHRGPAGPAALLTSRWLVEGSGQGAADFEAAGGGGSGRAFTHRRLPPGQG
jgi:glutamate-5-semialdehyde dehydrogenase